MDGLENRAKNSIERQFYEGVAEPSDPREFLLGILDKTKDDLYMTTDGLSEGESIENLKAQLPRRREKVQSIFSRMPELSSEIIKTYHEVSKKHELQPGRVALYVVGGRVNQKPLRHGSDVDVFFTVENDGQGMQPDYSKDAQSLIQAKILARKEFMQKLEPILDKYGALEKNQAGEVEGWFVEPKGYGVSDKKAREEWREASRASDSSQIAVRVAQE